MPSGDFNDPAVRKSIHDAGLSAIPTGGEEMDVLILEGIMAWTTDSEVGRLTIIQSIPNGEDEPLTIGLPHHDPEFASKMATLFRAVAGDFDETASG